MEKLKEENGDNKEAGNGEGAAIQPSPTPVGGRIRDIQKMVSFNFVLKSITVIVF